MQKKIVALYLRSSNEQNVSTRNIKNLDESDTIANQREYLKNVLIRKGLSKETIKEYIDDGYTGTNFDRPALQELIADVEAGKIGCVIVKDLSRLGRDYIGVGEYVEQLFPRYGVRIISVNDDWDSAEHPGETMELDTTFKTMLYEMYSRDLSVKRKTANRIRVENGTVNNGLVPYGYIRDPEDGRKWLVDEECAKVVRRIFHMYDEGVKVVQICRILTAEGVPTPAKRKEEQHNMKYAVKNQGMWNYSAMDDILGNEMYTGVLILNRMCIANFRDTSCTMNDKSEWKYFPDHHEAIIDKELYQRVFQRRNTFTRQKSKGAISRGFNLYCGHCGCKLKHTTKENNIYICPHGEIVADSECCNIGICEDAYKKLITKAINMEASTLLGSMTGKDAQKELRFIENQIAVLSKEAAKYREKRIAYYKQFKDGELDRNTFLKEKTEVLRLEEECNNELEVLKERLKQMKSKAVSDDLNQDVLEEYAWLDKYDEEAVYAMIDKVLAYNSGKIKIVWKYKDEYKDAVNEVDTQVLEEAIAATDNSVSAYTADMYYMKEEDPAIRKKLLDYCSKKFNIKKSDIDLYSDNRKSIGVFYMEDYMKFIELGRSGVAKNLVISSISVLYLTRIQFQALLFGMIPSLKCGFWVMDLDKDLTRLSEEELKEIYDMYAGQRRSDLLRFSREEIKNGKEPQLIRPVCKILYGYQIKDDGCYAIPEILDNVKALIKLALEGNKLGILRDWANDKNMELVRNFYYRTGQGKGVNSVSKWDLEKVSNLILFEEYAHSCRHCDKCKEIGKHCEKQPIMTEEEYKYLLENYSFRKRGRGRKGQADALKN